MQTTIELVLSIYVDDNGTLFYLTYKDEKTAREAADMLFKNIDVRNTK